MALITIPGYEPFQFQRASIEWHIDSVINNNGTFIMDETGLGKTITATTVAINLTQGPILVISRNANQEAWREVLAEIPNPSTVCTASKIPWGEYTAIIVDEAHNFKNMKTKSYIELFQIIKYNQAKVLLLSATPFQNRVSELKVMVSLIHFHTNTPAFILLGMLFGRIRDNEKVLENLSRYVGELGDKGFGFKHINEQVENEGKLRGNLVYLANIFATFSQRNTRKYIEDNYTQDVNLMGHFPKKHEKLIPYGNDVRFNKLFHDTIGLLGRMPFVIQNIYNYNPLKPKGQFTAMGGIIRSFLLKRLDSSIYAFQCSLRNAYDKLKSIEQYQRKNVIYIDDEKVDIIAEHFWPDYKRDCGFFQQLILMWENEEDTIKLDLLFNELKGEKCVVFTEYRDTLEIIAKEAKRRGIYDFVTFDGNSTDKELEQVRLNFDANLQADNHKITYLFTTDVLSESVNLHIAKEVIHYDQKWNPSKTAQRNGRIDRILKNGIVSDITITSFGVEQLIENILELEKTINKKQYISDIFINNLDPITLPRIPQFQRDSVLFYPKEGEHPVAINLYRTYMGDILFEAGIIQFLSDVNFKIVDFDPTGKVPEILKRPIKAHTLRKRSHYFRTIETNSHLYADTYEELVKWKAKLIPEPNFHKIISDIHHECKTEQRIPYETCTVWFKSHNLLGWE
jgi:hypothetical protein